MEGVGAELMFQAIKDGNEPIVFKCLKENKYLVYDYDHVSFSYIHYTIFTILSLLIFTIFI